MQDAHITHAEADRDMAMMRSTTATYATRKIFADGDLTSTKNPASNKKVIASPQVFFWLKIPCHAPSAIKDLLCSPY
jgi:hypothetical protein